MKMMNLFWVSLSVIALTSPGKATQLGFEGNLLNRPCQVDPSSTPQNVTFRDTGVPLYHTWPGKSYEEKFQIKLINCHASTMGKVVQLVFKGMEGKELPGYLQVSGLNQGKLGIGIIDIDGSSLLKLNQVHNGGLGMRVDSGSIVMNFKAYTQASPEAIAHKSVRPGDYNASATFELAYR